MPPGLDLQDRVAIVTGAGRGIGRSMALSMAEAGADIVAAARTRDEIDETAALVEKGGRQALAIAADVSRSDDVDRMVQRTLDRFGNVAWRERGACTQAKLASLENSIVNLLANIRIAVPG